MFETYRNPKRDKNLCRKRVGEQSGIAVRSVGTFLKVMRTDDGCTFEKNETGEGERDAEIGKRVDRRAEEEGQLWSAVSHCLGAGGEWHRFRWSYADEVQHGSE